MCKNFSNKTFSGFIQCGVKHTFFEKGRQLNHPEKIVCGLKRSQKRTASCSGPTKTLSSFVHGPAYQQSGINENVKAEKVYRTRFVKNSNFNQSNIQSLIAMSKGKALELYSKACRSSESTRITRVTNAVK